MRRALVVDDDRELADALAELLCLLGYAVVVADGVPRARAVLEDGRFDLILSDLTMPGETGLDLIRWLRGRPEPWHATTALLMSAIPVGEAIAAGSDGFVAKPYTIASVAAALAGHSAPPAPNTLRASSR